MLKTILRTLPLLPLLLSTPALAGGYFLPDRGVRGFSRGGANVVAADDLTALWYNPAQLASLKGTQILLEGAMVSFQMDFQRYPVEIGQSYQPVSNDQLAAPGAAVAVSSDFGLDSWVFALGVHAPYGTWSRYPDPGPQRYAMVRAEDLAFTAQASAAWQVTEGLRVGGGLTFLTLRINETNVVSSFPGFFGMPEDPELDGMVQMIATDSFVPSGTGGIWLSPGAWLPALAGFEIGLSFCPGLPISAKGKMRARLPEHYLYDEVTLDPQEPPITIGLRLPWIVRGGLRYRDLEDRFDLELDVVWEGWSAMDQIAINTDVPTYYRNLPTIGDYLIQTAPQEKHLKDTTSYRLGGSLRLSEWLILRAGAYFESGAAPDAFLSLASVDSAKIGAAIGAGMRVGAFTIDLGYLRVFQLPRDVPSDKSELMQTNLSNPEGATRIGGGNYQSGYNILGLAITTRIDQLF